MNNLLHKTCWIASLLLALTLVSCQAEKPGPPIVITTIPVEISAPQDIAINSRTGYIYIINRGNRVGILKDLEQIALLETGGDLFVQPNDLIVDEDHNWVYVVNKRGDSIAVIRDAEVVVIIEAAGRQPEKITVESTRGWAYIVGPYRKEPPHGEQAIVEGHVTILNGPELIGRIFLEDIAARHVVADPISGYVYVTGWQETDGVPGSHAIRGVVIVFDGLEEIVRLETLLPVNALDVHANTGEVYASGPDQQLYRFKQGKLLSTVKVMEGNGSIRNLRVHPTNDNVYLIGWGDQVEVIVVHKERVIARIPIAGTGLKMTIDPVTGNVYVADFWYNTVTVIQGTEVIATLETGLYPYGIAANPTNGRVYISNTNEGTVTVLDFED